MLYTLLHFLHYKHRTFWGAKNFVTCLYCKWPRCMRNWIFTRLVGDWICIRSVLYIYIMHWCCVFRADDQAKSNGNYVQPLYSPAIQHVCVTPGVLPAAWVYFSLHLSIHLLSSYTIRQYSCFYLPISTDLHVKLHKIQIIPFCV